MSVQTQAREYQENLAKWQQVEDCINERIKQLGKKYLPVPNATDTSAENTERYKQYLARAIFMNVVKRTHDGFLGLVYQKDPIIELPQNIEYIRNRANPESLSLEEFSKKLLSSAIQTGRAGILVDMMPLVADLPEDLTVETTQNRQADMMAYTATDIINWRVINGKLALVVLKEQYEDTTDHFSFVDKIQYRELRLDEDGLYEVRIWRLDGKDTNFSNGQTFQPTNSNGERLDYIPFQVIGTVNNDWDVDPSLLYSMSEINIGHYRNSADLEENCFVHGQLTLGISSKMSSDDWKATNPNGVQVGSRRGYFLGDGGSFHAIQAEPNQLADNLMARKEEQMLAIGAQLITRSGGAETAEAVRTRSTADSATLQSVTKNVSVAIETALGWLNLMMMGNEGDEIEFSLNQDFFDRNLNPQEIIALIQLFDRGRIGAPDFHRNLQKAGIVEEERTLEEVESEASQRSPITGMPSNTSPFNGGE